MRTTIATCAAVAALALAVTGCEAGEDKAAEPSSPAASSPATGETPTKEAEGSGEDEDESRVADLPSLVGMGLQAAQDKAQSLGFHHLASHDSLGRDRMQVLDRNWKVCFQDPGPGQYSTTAKIDFGTVKTEEQCPAKDGKAPAEAGATMPDFAGKSVKAARGSLDTGTSITVNDATGDDRMVLVESNWQICSQEPAPGAALDGQPVMFEAVKFGESCP